MGFSRRAFHRAPSSSATHPRRPIMSLSTSPEADQGRDRRVRSVHPLASVIIFQYNPAQISRQLEAPHAER